MNRLVSGSVEAFDTNWRNRVETQRYHFARGEPENQVQFAFQNHWRVFSNLIGDLRAGRALEVGCGRGSMAAFFADAGFETHLLDTSSTALQSALVNFEVDGLAGTATCGDALCLPYADASFDVVVSIGLLEHFADIEQPLREQMRVLKPGGFLLAYVVPERPVSVQLLAAPVNGLLRLMNRSTSERNASLPQKQPLYRNGYSSRDFLPHLRAAGAQDAGSFGMFPVPLVSHSWAFPFTPMSARAERRLIRLWRWVMNMRGQQRDPWICAEAWGLAFLIWAKR